MIVIDVNGNIESLKTSVLNELDALYSLELDRSEFLPAELARRLGSLTSMINREIAVYIDRKGSILDVSVGDSGTVALGEIDKPKHENRLSGIRCIHTHPNGDPELSAVDINSLIKLRLDAMVSLGVMDGEVTGAFAAILARGDDGSFAGTEAYGPFSPDDRRLDALMYLILERDRTSGNYVHDVEDEQEKAILVGLDISGEKLSNGVNGGEASLYELEELAHTAGAQVLDKVLQKRPVRDTAYYIGKGKAEELGLLRQALNADLVIFDDELSGAQVRNLEDITGARVIDRTALILDIFAQRAKSREGKLQVELAQLKYRLPRLIGLGTQLSRLGGGIGTRGPGEKKLEVDRRHIRRRIKSVEDELADVRRRRAVLRKEREKNRIPVFALVGYTNTGKSTLMNTICNASVIAENKLFATLDPTTRSFALPDGREALMTDTVGFIRKLPHELVESFKSTLEEVLHADVLLHVVDASDDEAAERIQVVIDLLQSLGALDKPMVTVLNKIDLAEEAERVPVDTTSGTIFEISALKGRGIEELKAGLAAILPPDEVQIELVAPYSEGWILPYIHENGKLLEQNYTEEGAKIVAMVDNSKVERLKEYIRQNIH